MSLELNECNRLLVNEQMYDLEYIYGSYTKGSLLQCQAFIKHISPTPHKDCVGL